MLIYNEQVITHNEYFKNTLGNLYELMFEQQQETIKVKGVGKMPIEEIVYLGLIAEMGYPSFDIEAYKAQAVAIRTFIKTNKKHNGEDFDLCGTTCCFVIADEVKKNKFTYEQLERFKQAVKETENELIYYNNEPISTPVFFAYGHNETNTPNDVWNSDNNRYPYLKSVTTIEKIEPQEMIFKKSEFYKMLNINNLDDIKDINRKYSGYITDIKINDKNYNGNQVRQLIKGLKSGNFDLYEYDDGIKIVAYGYGHGIGMSQYGANEMAKQGYNYKDILKHYYTGVEIKNKS